MLGYTLGRKKSQKRYDLPFCKEVTFKRARRGGKVLPKSRWKTVLRCENRKLHATNPDQCRVGGKGKKAHLFKRCPGEMRGWGDITTAPRGRGGATRGGRKIFGYHRGRTTGGGDRGRGRTFGARGGRGKGRR